MVLSKKCSLLDWEIQEAKRGNCDFHPAMWEKKGSSLYTAKNIQKYSELRKFTNRLFNKIDKLGGHVFYVGTQKKTDISNFDSNTLYYRTLKEAIKRIDEFCLNDCEPNSTFFIIMDEHPQRENLLTKASMAMYNSEEPRKTMIEPPFQAESHRYQTLQAADWIAGLVGRFGAYWKAPKEFPENEIFRKYFEERLTKVSKRSGIKNK